MNTPYEKRAADFACRDSNNGRTPLRCSAHLHVHVEFFYLLKGRTRAWVDSTEYIAEAGDLLLAFPNQVHQFETLEKEDYLLFIIHPDMMPELEDVFSQKLPRSALLKQADRFPWLLQTLQLLAAAAGQDARYRDLMLRGLSLSFFGQLLEQLEMTELCTEESHAIREIVRFCTQNFAGELSLSTLEDNLHLSRYYISHLFGSRLNIRFNDYVNSLRVSEACRLLRQTDDSITEICTEVGFGTLRTFNRAFMKQMGLSPSDYRRNRRVPPPSYPSMRFKGSV